MLVLMPAVVLILVALAAVAVDAAIALMGRRELGAATAAAANDAVIGALAEPAFYERCGALDLDPAAVAAIAARSMALRASTAYELDAVDTQVTRSPEGDAQVRVEAAGRVRLLFAPAVLGGGEQRVRAAGEAVARRASGVDPRCPEGRR